MGKGRSSAITLEALARSLGIQTEFTDSAGKTQIASPETLKALLRFWEIDIKSASDIRDAVRDQQITQANQVLPPVIVAWDGQPFKLEMQIPSNWEDSQASCQLTSDEGEVRKWNISLKKFLQKRLRLPALPFGYHELVVGIQNRICKTLLISAPTKTYRPPDAAKSWGAFLPMYAAHSSRSWGAGNFSDFQALGEWVANVGGKTLATLPITAAFLEPAKCVESPYSPASRLFWNEFYIDIERVPEFAASAAAQKLVRSKGFQKRLNRFRTEQLIDYPAQTRARRQVLELLAQELRRSTRLRDFQRFLADNTLLQTYAEFRAAHERSGTSWSDWEPRMRFGKLQAGDFSENARTYHLYVQWLAHEQMEALGEACKKRGLNLYLDLPLGAHPDSFDVWREQDLFAITASVGAPPDALSSQGQNWGFPPLHPARLREGRYEYLINYLRFQMRHAGILRIDHVMSLHRLYWIPPGFSATQGAYVRYPAEEIYAILSVESHRHKTRIVGENLGTVPPEVNEGMKRHGLGKMYVLQFEQRPDAKNALPSPPADSVASINTHDTPTFAAHWRGTDLKQRVASKLLAPKGLKREIASRKELNKALIEFLRKHRWLSPAAQEAEEIVSACLRCLARSPAEMTLVNLEDLWAEEMPQNVPGTVCEYPNWRRKAARTIEEMKGSKAIGDFLKELTAFLNFGREV
jgi:4-alpha-glucanotransferase